MKAILIDADPHARWLNVFIAADLKGMERFHLPNLLQRRQKEQKAKDKAVAAAAVRVLLAIPAQEIMDEGFHTNDEEVIEVGAGAVEEVHGRVPLLNGTAQQRNMTHDLPDPSHRHP